MRDTDSKWGVFHAAVMFVAIGCCALSSVMWPLVLVAAPSFMVLIAGSRRQWSDRRTFGSANTVTALRLLLLFVLIATGPRVSPYWSAAVLLLVLALDGLDGWLARHFGRASVFGARFDTEVDALLVLTGCLSLFVFRGFGAWVLLGGFLRYATVLLLAVKPPGGGEQVRSRLGRYAYVVAVIGIAAAHVLPPTFARTVAMAATAMLIYSFAVSVSRAYRAGSTAPDS